MTESATDLLDRITLNPGQCGGRPCIRGTRLRVSDILDLLAAGASFDEILADYPLERDDIVAALQVADNKLNALSISIADKVSMRVAKP